MFILSLTFQLKPGTWYSCHSDIDVLIDILSTKTSRHGSQLCSSHLWNLVVEFHLKPGIKLNLMWCLYSLSFISTTAKSHRDKHFQNTSELSKQTPAIMRTRVPGIWSSNTGLCHTEGGSLRRMTTTAQRYRNQSLRRQTR